MAAKVRGTPGAVNWRRLAIRLHFWGGIVTGPFILVLGLSGLALVFRTEIESLESTTPLVASTRQPAPSLDAVVGVARARHPSAELHALRIPSTPGRPYRVELRTGRQRLDIAVDPSTLQILGGRAAERSLMIAVHSLHAGFHAGRAGSLVVGLLGAWLVVESVTGLWLCWPSARRGRPRVIDVEPTEAAGSRGLHRLVGGASLVLGVIVALTGTLLTLGSVTAPAGAGVSPVRTLRTLSRLDVIATRVAAALPGATITALVADDGDAIRVETTAGAVIVDGETGRVDRARSGQALGAWDWITHLHSGDFAGWASRVAYALVGLGLTILSITGYLITARRTTGSS